MELRMHHLFIGNVVLATFFLLIGCQANQLFGRAAAPVDLVQEVTLTWSKKEPSHLIIKATGMVNSGGWGVATLSKRENDKKDKDDKNGSNDKTEKNDVLKFNLRAVPPAPGSIVTAAFVTVTAELTLKSVPADVKTIQVHAASNTITKKLPPRP